MQVKEDTKGTPVARELALNILYEVMEKGAYANICLENKLRNSQLSPNDKNLVTEIVNGSVRMIKHLDWVLNLFLRKPIDKQNPWLRNILRMSAYQVLFMDRIPNYAVVNDAVDLCRQKCSKALAAVCNGVLRNLIRERGKYVYPPADSIEYLAIYYSQPDWLVKKWVDEYGREAAQAMLYYLNQRVQLTLRHNSLKADRTTVLQELAAEGIQAVASPIIPWSIRVESMDKSLEGLKSFQKGQFYVQNEAAMLAGVIVAPQPGERVLDLCCGVGGKTTHFAEMMDNQGHIEAVDLHEHKIKLLKTNCHRLGVTIVEGVQKDILQIKPVPNRNRVFLDAPCSGLGVLNRRSDSRWRKEPAEIAKLNELQKNLLSVAGQAVLPGGVLVYSTCTVNRLENEAVVNDFLKYNPDYKLEAIDRQVDFLPLDPTDRQAARLGFLTLLPGKYGVDGMFYARMRRG